MGKFLDKCLNSICNQTINNKEIIIIDDASTDNSLDIIMKYKKIYNDIVVIQKKINGGQGKARNEAIDIAKGDFIGFVDGDDYIEADMFRQLYDEAIENDLDIAICNFNLYFEQKNETIKNVNFNNHEVIDRNEAIRRFLVEKTIEGFSWNKIFKKEIFKNVRYIEGRFYEDIPTVFKLIVNSNRIGFINSYLYNYVQRNNSVTCSVKSKNLYHYILSIGEISKILEINNLCDKFINEIRLYNLKIIYSYYDFLVCRKNGIEDSYITEMKYFYEIYRKKINIANAFINKNFSLKEKIRVLFFRFKYLSYIYFKFKNIKAL